VESLKMSQHKIKEKIKFPQLDRCLRYYVCTPYYFLSNNV